MTSASAWSVLQRYGSSFSYPFAFASDGTDQASLRFEKMIDGMKCYTPQQIESALIAAGFSGVKTDRHPDKPWITVIAKK